MSWLRTHPLPQVVLTSSNSGADFEAGHKAAIKKKLPLG